MVAGKAGAKTAAKKTAPKKSSGGGGVRGPLGRPELVKLLLTVPEVAHKLSVGRSAVYGLMARGELRYITVGRVRRVPVEAVGEYVAHALNAGRSGYPAA